MASMSSSPPAGAATCPIVTVCPPSAELTAFCWCVGNRRDVLECAFGQSFVDGAIYVAGWMSRKTQVVPALERAFAGAP